MTVLLSEHRIYTQVARSNPSVLRVQPPLTITEEEVSQFLEAVEACCREVQATETFDQILAKTVLGQHGALASSKQPGLIGRVRGKRHTPRNCKALLGRCAPSSCS